MENLDLKGAYKISINYPIINIKYNGNSKIPIKTKVEFDFIKKITSFNNQNCSEPEKINLEVNVTITEYESKISLKKMFSLFISNNGGNDEFSFTKDFCKSVLIFDRVFSDTDSSFEISINNIIENRPSSDYENTIGNNISFLNLVLISLLILITGFIFWKSFENNISKESTKKKLNSKIKKPIYIGLPNLRNTCFINSLLQSLFHIKAFRDTLSTIDNDTSKNLSKIFEAMDVLSKNNKDRTDIKLLDSKNNPVKKNKNELHARIEYFINNFPFLLQNKGRQVDVAEFYSNLIDEVEDITLNLNNLLETTIEVTEKCNTCNFITLQRTEKHAIINFQIPEETFQGKFDVYDAFKKLYGIHEELEGRSNCETCNVKRYGFAKIVTFPKILCLNLGRVLYIPDQNLSIKKKYSS